MSDPTKAEPEKSVPKNPVPKSPRPKNKASISPEPAHPARSGAPDPERREALRWLWRLPVLAALAGIGWGAWEAYYVHFDKVTPDTPDFTPLKPQRIATLGALGATWSSVAFGLDNGSGTLPAIVLNVPEAVAGGITVGSRHFLALSRICTHQGCPVTLRKDLAALEVAFNYRATEPALACPCHLSVFSPLEAGKAVSGPARRPLPRVQLEQRGEALYAVGLEEPRA